jgi:hypothetical protein
MNRDQIWDTLSFLFIPAAGLVESIQLQVVCQRLWNQLKTSQVDQINQGYFENLEDVDKALEAFYVEAISETSSDDSTYVTGIELFVDGGWAQV